MKIDRKIDFEKVTNDAAATLLELAISRRQIADLNKWRLALESLTPQGSEFHNDLDACLAYIHKRQMDDHERYKAKHRECADLKARLADANRGAQVNALVNESLAKKLKLAVEANRYALATFRALNSYTFEDSDHGLLIAEAVKKLEAFHDEGGEQR